MEGQTDILRAPDVILQSKLGLGYRRMDTYRTLNGIDVAPAFNFRSRAFSVKEDMDTDYLGGFLGAVAVIPVHDGLALSVDGEAGLYWGHTEYRGKYAQTTVAFLPTANITQRLSPDDDEAAIIAALKVALDQDFGGFKVGIFGRGEYYSYAPKTRHNDIDNGTFGGSQTVRPSSTAMPGQRPPASASRCL